MRRVTAREANQRFSEVLSAVETGEQVVITKRGRPVALMSPYPAEALAAERQAAIDRMIAAMNEPVTLRDQHRDRSGSASDRHELVHASSSPGPGAQPSMSFSSNTLSTTA